MLAWAANIIVIMIMNVVSVFVSIIIVMKAGSERRRKVVARAAWVAGFAPWTSMYSLSTSWFGRRLNSTNCCTH